MPAKSMKAQIRKVRTPNGAGWSLLMNGEVVTFSTDAGHKANVFFDRDEFLDELRANGMEVDPISDEVICTGPITLLKDGAP